ncbi:hypothetical protein Vadar_011649 [Vaccinium darrowii]|uniref:Uncharacterized protein n=1 Tax=Vaccinium darrowii TaxID=229202 RepID=A0ACB7Z4P7_9ERIC|nr:hypothetical protein Vadar_011649 [Vaccinium darrowii]
MDLPNSILDLERNFTLLTTLKEDLEAVQIIGGPSVLEDELQKVRDLSRVVNQELLVPTEDILFAANLRQAADSDALIERSVGDHSTLMSILDRCHACPVLMEKWWSIDKTYLLIESALPTLARPRMSLDPSEDAIVESLKQSLRQLETLGAQREGLEDKLKEMKRKQVHIGYLQDDILLKLMASTGSYEDLLRNETTKYDQFCTQIAQNIEEQGNSCYKFRTGHTSLLRSLKDPHTS